MERRTELIEIATDTEGRELWRKPYEFSCLSAPGELITENWATYSCVSSVRVGDEIRTILKYESSAKPTDRRATEQAKPELFSPEIVAELEQREKEMHKQPTPASPEQIRRRRGRRTRDPFFL